MPWCYSCGSRLQLHRGRRGPFWSCERRPDCGVKLEAAPSGRALWVSAHEAPDVAVKVVAAKEALLVWLGALWSAEKLSVEEHRAAAGRVLDAEDLLAVGELRRELMVNGRL